jgi:uncharacterized membrane protein YoaK (UPF0700 family)
LARRYAITNYDYRLRLLAACLSCLAGYVDAIGFIKTGLKPAAFSFLS